MSALDVVLSDGWRYSGAVQDARSELARLRADLHAAQERIAELEAEMNQFDEHHRRVHDAMQAAQERIADQTRKLDEARKVIERCSAYIGSIDHGENTKSYRMCDAWLAANPAPSPDEQRCTCGTGDATMPEYHAAGCALKAEPQP